MIKHHWLCKSQYFWNNTHIIQTPVTQFMKSLRLYCRWEAKVSFHVGSRYVHYKNKWKIHIITYDLVIFINFCLSTGIFQQVLYWAFIAWSSCNTYILSNYVSLNGAFSELTAMNMEGSGHGLTAPALASWDRKIMKSLGIVSVLAMICDKHQKKKLKH
jgi:predicted transglutaminase-like protease